MKSSGAHIALRARIGMMAMGWGTVGLCYSIGRITPRVAHVLHEHALDRLIPFEPSAIWLYLSFFLLVPAAYLFAAPRRLEPLTRAMRMSAVVAGVVFVAWPTVLIYPPISHGAVGGAALRALADFDSPQNCMPSLHGALTLLCMVALVQRDQPWRSVLVVVWGAAVMWSVIAARRHLAIDLGAGLMLGAVCAWWAARSPVTVAAITTVADTSKFNSSPEICP